MNLGSVNLKTLIKDAVYYLLAFVLAACSLWLLPMFMSNAIVQLVCASCLMSIVLMFNYRRKLPLWRNLLILCVLLLAPSVGFFYLGRLQLLQFFNLLLVENLCLLAALGGTFLIACLPKELTLYLFFGGLTTLVSVGSFTFFDYLFANNAQASWLLPQSASFIISCLFAFFTNRAYVFESKGNILREALRFIGVRFASSLFFEFILLGIFVDLLYFNRDLSKILCAVIVVIANYVLSKVFVFVKSKED